MPSRRKWDSSSGEAREGIERKINPFPLQRISFNWTKSSVIYIFFFALRFRHLCEFISLQQHEFVELRWNCFLFFFFFTHSRRHFKVTLSITIKCGGRRAVDTDFLLNSLSALSRDIHSPMECDQSGCKFHLKFLHKIEFQKTFSRQTRFEF